MAFAGALTCVSVVHARDLVGVYSGWAAFAEPAARRCHATAGAEPPAAGDAALSVSAWPGRNVRGEVHARLSRPSRPGSAVILSIDGAPFTLAARGRDAWAATRDGERAMVAAMRRGVGARVYGRDERGRQIADGYRLAGAASAIDAMLIACARTR